MVELRTAMVGLHNRMVELQARVARLRTSLGGGQLPVRLVKIGWGRRGFSRCKKNPKNILNIFQKRETISIGNFV
jgi:hypothetical protein